MSEQQPRPRGERILLATRNRHKMAEIRELLSGLPWKLVSLAELGVEPVPQEEEVEVHETFAENAVAKARHFQRRTELFTLADDSGLCVDALGGGPGVRTKRFAPQRLVEQFGRTEANNRYLLRLMESVPDGERSARFRCAVAAFDGRAGRVWEGRVEGRIARETRGTGGFGYDPLFVVPGYGKTFGELPAEVKAEMSHRARAFGKVRLWLADAAAAGTTPREDP